MLWVEARALRPQQLIKCRVKVERKWDRNKLALNLKVVYASGTQPGKSLWRVP